MSYQNKRVAVTGGAGFVGKHLVEMLVADGADVIVLDDFSRGTNIVKGANYLRADATSEMACMAAFKGVDVVFNLAATVAGVIYNQSHHTEMFDKNIRLLTTPVIAAKARNVPVFLQVSSVCVYSPAYTVGSIEANGHLGEPVPANIGYSYAKRMGEYMAAWSGIERVAIVRPSNIYGPHDYFDERAHVIPALIKKALDEPQVVLHGSGHERREFLYVEDAARGMFMAADRVRGGIHTYNLGTSGHTTISIHQLAQTICYHCGQADKKIVTTPDEDSGDRVRYSDATKAKRELGWHYQIPLEEGLEKTIKWYRHERKLQISHHYQ